MEAFLEKIILDLGMPVFSRLNPPWYKVGLTHPDLLGEKRLENGEEHVEEPARLADVDLPEPEGKPILK